MLWRTEVTEKGQNSTRHNSRSHTQGVQEVSWYAVHFPVKTAKEDDQGVLVNYNIIVNLEYYPGTKRQIWYLDPEQI